jgi:hypothetical protein
MFISATQVTSVKVPSDASAIVIQVALKQQQEFEEALKRAQERRELEQSQEQARLESRRERHDGSTKSAAKSDDSAKEPEANADSGTVGQGTTTSRGAAVDVTA